MSCVFFVGWCGSTKRIHYGCVSSSGCRFSYILDFRCVVWEMKKPKNTCASVNTTKIDTHARLYELGGNEQSKLSCQASHTFCKPWRWRMADVWAINRMPTVQTGMAERFWKTPNLYANEGVVRCNTPCSFSAERCEAGWFEFAVGRVCDLASLGHPHSCLLKGTSFVFSGWSPDMKMTRSDTSWPNCKAT